MSDDIDRLNGILEDLRILKDGLTDGHEAMRDIIAAVTPVELETDPEGHGALRDLATDIRTASAEVVQKTLAINTEVLALCRKARL